jgi:hypothetical protein
MGSVERGVVKGSNKHGPGGDDRNNGFLPLGGQAGTVHQSPFQGAGRSTITGGSFPLGGGGPAIAENQYRFNVDEVPGSNKPMPWVTKPGKGAVPVNPLLKGGTAAEATVIADDAKAAPGR